jgi:hypothetical protein
LISSGDPDDFDELIRRVGALEEEVGRAGDDRAEEAFRKVRAFLVEASAVMERVPARGEGFKAWRERFEGWLRANEDRLRAGQERGIGGAAGSLPV